MIMIELHQSQDSKPVWINITTIMSIERVDGKRYGCKSDYTEIYCISDGYYTVIEEPEAIKKLIGFTVINRKDSNIQIYNDDSSPDVSRNSVYKKKRIRKVNHRKPAKPKSGEFILSNPTQPDNSSYGL